MRFIRILLLLILCPVLLQAQTHYTLKLQGHWNNAKHSSGAYTYSSLWGWASDRGEEYAILGSRDSIYFIDISRPDTPVLRAVQGSSSSSCTNREFKTYSHYCYAVSDECTGTGHLQVFDIQYLPDSVHKVYDTDTLAGSVHTLYIDKDRLYLAANRYKLATSGQDAYHLLTIASLQNPEAPSLLAHLDGQSGSSMLYSYTHDLHVRGDTAYLSNGDDGLFIYDLRKPKAPKLLLTIQRPYPQAGYNHSNWISEDGSYLVFTDETHGSSVKLYDISDLKDSMNTLPLARLQSTFGEDISQGSIAHNAYIKDKKAYVAYYHEGVLVYDISQPRHPVQLAQYDTYPQNDTPSKTFPGINGCWNIYPFFASGNIIASDMTNGLFILKLDTSLSGITETSLKKNFAPVSLINSSNTILVNASLTQTGDYTFSLTDMTGRTLFTEERIVPEGDTRFSLDTKAALTNGMYLLNVRNGKGMETFRLMKQ